MDNSVIAPGKQNLGRTALESRPHIKGSMYDLGPLFARRNQPVTESEEFRIY